MTQARVAMAVVALLVAAGLGLLVIDNAPGRTATVAGGPATTEMTPAADPSTTLPTLAAAATGTETPARQKKAGPEVEPAAPAVAAVKPGPVSPPPPGTYRYRYSGGDTTVDGTLAVTPGPAANRQTHRLTSGADTQQTVVEWSSTARTTISAGTGAAPVCAWTPGLLSLRLPLTPGATWKADGTCGATPGPAASSIHRTEEATVQGATRTQVAGRPLDVWLIARHTLTEIAASTGKAVIEAQTSELFAPSLGLVVYQVTRTATPQPDRTIANTTQTTELLDQRPV